MLAKGGEKPPALVRVWIRAPPWKQCEAFSENWSRITIWSSGPTPRCGSKTPKHVDSEHDAGSSTHSSPTPRCRSKTPKHMDSEHARMPPVLTAALFTAAELWRQPERPSAGEWAEENMRYRCIYAQGMPRSYKSKMSPFAETWMDLKDIILSETCQSEKDQYCLIPLPCGI